MRSPDDSSRPSRRQVLAGATALVAGLAGCSGDGDPGTDTDTTSSTPTGTTTPPATAPTTTGRVPRPYGGFYMEAHDANGGWVARRSTSCASRRGWTGARTFRTCSPPARKTGCAPAPPVSTWSGTSRYYGMGVLVDLDGSGDPKRYWHNGSLPGSYSLLVHFEQRDLALAALCNARARDRTLGSFFEDAQTTLFDTATSVSEWPDRDLFDRYS